MSSSASAASSSSAPDALKDLISEDVRAKGRMNGLHVSSVSKEVAEIAKKASEGLKKAPIKKTKEEAVAVSSGDDTDGDDEEKKPAPKKRGRPSKKESSAAASESAKPKKKDDKPKKRKEPEKEFDEKGEPILTAEQQKIIDKVAKKAKTDSDLKESVKKFTIDFAKKYESKLKMLPHQNTKLNTSVRMDAREDDEKIFGVTSYFGPTRRVYVKLDDITSNFTLFNKKTHLSALSDAMGIYDNPSYGILFLQAIENSNEDSKDLHWFVDVMALELLLNSGRLTSTAPKKSGVFAFDFEFESLTGVKIDDAIGKAVILKEAEEKKSKEAEKEVRTAKKLIKKVPKRVADILIQQNICPGCNKDLKDEQGNETTEHDSHYEVIPDVISSPSSSSAAAASPSKAATATTATNAGAAAAAEESADS